MKPEPTEPEKQLGKDLKTFEKLPEKTKDLQVLSDLAEKKSGQDRAELDRLIQTKAEEA